ncbi:MAG: molybdopterin synthase sulfur carrier subunit [Alteromonadaceae bacterium]|jgi:molybdopterin synthase sulfur carrier subunit
MIKVIFFAALREQLNCSEIELSAENISNVSQVKQALITEYPQWQAILENIALLSAVNHDMVNGEFAVKSGDEVAFFPPVTGG